MFNRLLIHALAVALLALPGVAHAEWHEASSAHFVVYSNDRPEKLQQFATELEKFDKALRVLRNLGDPVIGKANRLTVYIVGDTDAVAKLAGGDTVAGFYRARASGSVAFAPRRSGSGSENDLNPQQILLHEYSHHIMFSMAPNAAYPLWFSEGWAEFHATAQFRKDGAVGFGAPPQYRAYSLLDGNWLKADKMMVADSLKLDENQREGLYGRGWLLTHYLTFGSERKGQLSGYIGAINEGKTPIEAAQVFGDLRMLDKELERYKTGKFQVLGVNPSALKIGEVTVRKLTAGEAATMRVRILSKNGVDAKSAPSVYTMAKKACAPFPNDPGAQMVLAEAAYDAGDHAEAEAAADRAIAVDPKLADAFIYKAMARMAVAEKAKDVSKPTWSAIRKIIVTANKLDTEDPEPLILYFQSFIQAGMIPTKSAREGLYYAFALAPQDPGLRMNAAMTYMNDGNFDMARTLLKPLAFDPHNKGLAGAAAEMLKIIDTRAKEAPKQDAKAKKPEAE
jgi:Flp pilus assembly protein TadD